MSQSRLDAGAGTRSSIMLAQPIVRRLAVASLLVALLFVFAARAGAQRQLASLKELESQRKSVEVSRFRSGQEKPAAADKDMIDAEAKYLVYRFSAQPPIFGDANKGMQKYQNDFADYIRQIEVVDAWKKNGEFRRQLSLALVTRFKD